MGNGCFNYQTTSVISVNSVHSVQKTQLKCVFCMQVLQQPHLKVKIAEGFTNLYREQRLSNQKNTGIKKPVTGHDSGTIFRFQPFSAALRQEGS